MRLDTLRNSALALSIVCAMGLQADEVMSSVTSVANLATGFNDDTLYDCDFDKDGVISKDEKEKCRDIKMTNGGKNDFEHFNFQPNHEIGNCKPGRECDAVIANSDDYFQSENLPGSDANTVVMFSKEDVDKIVQKRIRQCKDDPKSCGIETGFSDKVTDVRSVVESIEGKDIPIAGYYLHYGKGSYDWLYMDPKATYVFKLEEGVTKSGALRWTPVDTSKNRVFESIQVDSINNVVHFGSANSLPGATAKSTKDESVATASSTVVVD